MCEVGNMDEALIELETVADSNGNGKKPPTLLGKLVSLCRLISEMPACMKTLHSLPDSVSFSISRPSNGEQRSKTRVPFKFDC